MYKYPLFNAPKNNSPSHQSMNKNNATKIGIEEILTKQYILGRMK